MRDSTFSRSLFRGVILVAAGSALPGSFTNAQLSSAAQLPVIVILKDQLADRPASRESMGSRTLAISSAQTAALGMLQRAGPHSVHSFQTINAFAAKVTPSEAAALAIHPDVQAVVPDVTIRMPRLQQDIAGGAHASGTARTDDGLCNKARRHSGTRVYPDLEARCLRAVHPGELRAISDVCARVGGVGATKAKARSLDAPYTTT